MGAIHRWADLTGPELADVAAGDPVAVWPLAAVEQHGAHLPLGTDTIIGEGLLAAACDTLRETPLPDARDLLILPTLAPAASLEHSAYPGTLSLAAEQVIATLESVGADLARAGIRRLVLFNSHGGNKAAIDMAALQLRHDHGLLVVKASYFRFAPPADTLAASELAHGLHGGALETAMMLHLAPARVRRDALADFPSYGAERAAAGATLGPEGDAGFAWRAEDLNPQGVTGNAASATAEQGERLVETFGQRLAQIWHETATFDLSRLGSEGQSFKTSADQRK